MTMYPLVDYPKYREPFSTLAELMVAVDMLDPTLNYPLSWHFHDEDPDDEPCFSIAIVMPRRTEVTEFEVQGPFDRAEIDAWLNTTIRARVAAWYGWDERPVLTACTCPPIATSQEPEPDEGCPKHGRSPHPPTREQIAEALYLDDADHEDWSWATEDNTITRAAYLKNADAVLALIEKGTGR